MVAVRGGGSSGLALVFLVFGIIMAHRLPDSQFYANLLKGGSIDRYFLHFVLLLIFAYL